MGNVICFHGCDHKCGTSMLARCVAENLAKTHKDLAVLLVHADSNSLDGYGPGVRESMDNIRPYLAERLIDVESVVEKSKYKDNLYIIGGNTTPCSNDGFLPDMSEFFISVIKNSFDFVICDCSSDIESGLSLGALFSADLIYMVITQSESSVRRYEWLRGMYSKLLINTDNFVINMFRRNSPYTKSYLAERLNLSENNFSYVRDSSYGSDADFSGRSILSCRDGAFSKDIKALTDKIYAFNRRNN